MVCTECRGGALGPNQRRRFTPEPREIWTIARTQSSTLRTRVTKRIGKPGLSVFCCSGMKLGRMKVSFLLRLRRFTLWLVFDLLLASGLLAFSAWADTSSHLHHPPVGGCYCGCAMAKTSAGCGKMCDLPKFASRRWAVTCSKPHATANMETPEAQPHLPHPPHAERASN